MVRTLVCVALLTLLLILFALSTAGGTLALIPLVAYCGIPVILFRLEMRARHRFLSEAGARKLPAARIVNL